MVPGEKPFHLLREVLGKTQVKLTLWIEDTDSFPLRCQFQIIGSSYLKCWVRQDSEAVPKLSARMLNAMVTSFIANGE